MQDSLILESVNFDQTQIEFIPETTTFLDLRDEWNTLLEKAQRKSVFLTWEWQYSWWNYYQHIEKTKRLCMLIVRNKLGQLRAILPLYKSTVKISHVLSLDLLYFVGSGHESSEYLDIICDQDFTGAEVQAVLDQLPKFAVDGLHLSDLRDDSILLPVALEWGKSHAQFSDKYYWKTCPYIPLQGDYEQFISSLSKNMRYNIRRRTRNLEKNATVDFSLISNRQDAQDAVHILYQLHRKRWETKEGDSKFDDPVRERFHERVVGPMLEAGHLRFYCIYVDHKPVAILYCFHFHGHVFYYQAGMEPELEKKSIGMVVMGKAIEASFNEGAHEFDFLRGLEDYKFRWTDKTRDTHIWEAAFSKKAAAYFSAQKQWRNVKKQIKSVIKEQ